MTIHEAIEHAEETAAEQIANGCIECANEHLQLASWLRQLIWYRAYFTVTTNAVQEQKNNRITNRMIMKTFRTCKQIAKNSAKCITAMCKGM